MAVNNSFDAQFAALMGLKPFCWQRRLFHKHFLTGDLPPALDLPTGLGKTSVMTIWYLALKAGAPVPRRLVYVVDRRAVVDQATTVADEIKNKSGDTTLRASTLRGQHVDNRAWLENPGAPAIIVGTIDMIGSRLLFSGYGVSRKMRPYHAGLLGADTLVVLDESHLVPPFEELMKSIAGDRIAFGPRDVLHRKILPSFKLLSLSATGRNHYRDVFHLEEDDGADELVRKRLEAKKRATAVATNNRKLAVALADEAWKLAEESRQPIRCLVYCNSRDVAEKVRDALVKRGKKVLDIELFVGARRVWERLKAAERLQELGFLAGSGVALKKHAFLVATSAGEVGVDLDADHMVCDLVPWERMVQRLGRVNRRGDGDARIVLIHEGEPKPDDLRAMIAWRSRILLDALPANKRGIDVSPGALRELKLRAEKDPELGEKIEAATTPEPLRPALTRALVDAWSMTSLDRHTGRPEVGPWLRGWIEDDEPQTSVVWRAYLPVRMEGEDASSKEVEDFFEAAPSHASEELKTQTWRVVDWLMVRTSAMLKARRSSTGSDDRAEVEESGDLDSNEAASLSPKPLGVNDIVAFALTSAGDLRKSYRFRDLNEGKNTKRLEDGLRGELTGATLIVDARLRGLTDGLLKKTGDMAVRTADDGGVWLPTLEDGGPVVRFRVHQAVAPKAVKVAPRETRAFVTRRSDEGEDIELLLVGTWATEESRAGTNNPQLLVEHHSWTEQRALAIAEAVGLTGNHKKVLSIAARLHDEGKKARAWQAAFNAPRDGNIYAKTKGPISYAFLHGYRHEFGSLPFAEKDAAFKVLPPDLQDLVLHLITAHHGGGRPLIETTGCEDAPPSALNGRARDVALRFARLQKRWGPWGLAWWEALLRAADQQASRDNDERPVAYTENTKITEDA